MASIFPRPQCVKYMWPFVVAYAFLYFRCHVIYSPIIFTVLSTHSIHSLLSSAWISAHLHVENIRVILHLRRCAQSYIAGGPRFSFKSTRINPWGPFYLHKSTLIPEWIGNYIHMTCGVKLVIHSQMTTVKLVMFEINVDKWFDLVLYWACDYISMLR